MNDLATFVISAAAVLGLFQIITLIFVITTKTAIKKIAGEKMNTPSVETAAKETLKVHSTGGSGNTDGKAQIRTHSKPQSLAAAAAATTSVDNSLRDINLRLKNAERDQQNARRKIRESFNKKERDAERARHSASDNRRDAARSTQKVGSSAAGKLPFKPVTDNHTQSSDKQQRAIEKLPSIQGISGQKPDNTTVATPSPMSPAVKLANEAAEGTNTLSATSTSVKSQPDTQSSLQHGRFTTVKRRALKTDNDVEQNVKADNTSAAVVPEAQAAGKEDGPRQENSLLISNEIQTTNSTNSEISYGRR